ncbi:MAG: two-component regulator propeller domain-containing protein [Cyclobacteriaceae bacterium]
MRLFYCLAIVLNGGVLLGQSSLKFEHYGVEDGLVQSSANAMIQDHEDMLWVGTFGGLCSFDGYDFRSFQHVPQDSTTLSENVVWDLLLDSDKSLWAGTKSGLSRLNRRTNTFDNFYILDPWLGKGTLAIKALLETSDGKLLIGTEGKGVYQFIRNTGVFSPLTYLPNDLKVSDMAEDSQGRVYLTTENKGLFVIDQNEQAISFREEGWLSETALWTIFIDKKDLLWIGTDTKGVIVGKAGGYDFIIEDKLLNKASCKVQAITQGTDGRIWVGTGTQGVYVYDPDNGETNQFKQEPGKASTLHDNNVTQIIVSSNENVFIGFYLNGLDKVTAVPFSNFRHNPRDNTSLSDDHVFTIYNDRSDQMWFGTFGGGLNRMLDSENGKFKHYRHKPDDPQTISHDWVRSIYEDSRGNFWVATWGGGLNLMNRQEGTFTRFNDYRDKNGETFSLNIITCIYEDDQQRLWLGTYGAGIDVFSLEDGTISHIKNDDNNPNSLSDDHITSIFQIKRKMYIGTYGGGLNEYDLGDSTFRRYIPERSTLHSISDYKVLNIFDESQEPYMWITTLGGGLNQFFPEQGTFVSYTMKDGLSDNHVLGLLRQPNGSYWISTNNGLNHFDPQESTFRAYGQSDGLSGIDFSLSAYAKDAKGKFYFGGRQGVTSFYPDQVKPRADFAKMKLHMAKIDGKEIFDLNELKVDYGDRVQFQYAAVNPLKPDKISYAYRLIGLNDLWRDMGSIRQIEFATLRPGDYELQVRCGNEEGQWSNDFVSASFTVTPPWYLTWWFRIGLVLFMFLSAIGYYFNRVNRLKSRQKFLEETVAIRTSELKHANEEQKRLESFKDSLVNMVAHDLKNPLVTILASSSDQGGQAARIIKRAGQNMLLLIDNMLDVQRMQETSLKLKLTDFELGKLLNHILEIVGPSATDKAVKIESDKAEEFKVRGDKDSIERVMINLLSNAVKYSPPGDIVRVAFETRSGNLRISVIDHGPGIPPSEHKKLFKKYYQGQQAESHSSGSRSYGLGLAYCKMVMDAHKSEVGVISAPNAGSQFWIELPLVSKRKPISKGQTSNVKQEQQAESIISLNTRELNILESYQFDSLDLYQTGEWFNLLERLKAEESAGLSKLAQSLDVILSNFDEKGMEQLRKQINVLKTQIDSHGTK